MTNFRDDLDDLDDFDPPQRERRRRRDDEPPRRSKGSKKRRGGGKRLRKAPEGRAYEHTLCGGQTFVSEDSFDHICDPFRICTGTFCVTCNDFASLDDVFWVDTGECVADYRSRLRSQTPAIIKIWRFGTGLVLGLLLGALIGFLIAVVADAKEKTPYVLITGGIVGALFHWVGAWILNTAMDVDYRREV